MGEPSQLTIDGLQLNKEGYSKFATFLADRLTGNIEPNENLRTAVNKAVNEKNWFWHNDFKIPNGVHVYGRRYEPFGPDNYPAELEKIRQMTANRDTAVWKTAIMESYDLAAADAHTRKLPAVQTNYTEVDGTGNVSYLYGEEALASMKTAPGFHIELFASEEDFPDLANPVQLSFDNKGRLWVAVMPTYPHWRPGDPKPNDKLLILEDTDGDGKADKQTVFADSLHLPVGFEIAPEGVYVSQGTNLKLLIDENGDDHADRVEILLSGFDDHDTHHVISAFCADPSGAIYMGEGVFLHTNVETPYGPVRGTNGGFYRYNPVRKRLERTAQLSIPNPWGIAFDKWGQPFFAETSGPDVLWMMPGTVKPRYGIATPKSRNLIEDAHRVRPTSGLEFVSSRHFPDEMQGDLLINNTIGFLGMKDHAMNDSGTGFESGHRSDIVVSSDKNFRPVDMEFAPDGSLYLVDWHNVLVGHMQHNARDPLRDHVHGRIYRITYPSRPLVEPAKIDGATIAELLDNLKLPEYRTRYRTRRELRGRDADSVYQEVVRWVDSLDPNNPEYEHYLVEGLWVSWGINMINEQLLLNLLHAEDYHARAAAVRVLRYMGHQVENQADLLQQAAADEHGRVRLEAIVASSWLPPDQGMKVLETASKYPLDDWMLPAYDAALAVFGVETNVLETEEESISDLSGEALAMFNTGKEIFERDGFCITCHQEDGKGLPASGFPPLAGTSWVNGEPETLIKIILKGLQGPILVLDQEYPGQVPMTPYEAMLSDEEVAAVATYVRNSFGNSASPVTAGLVTDVRKAISDKKGFYSPEELLNENP
jgi:mono/diheme cytochrome c family protein/glucose/arabinose dehydrogenase